MTTDASPPVGLLLRHGASLLQVVIATPHEQLRDLARVAGQAVLAESTTRKASSSRRPKRPDAGQLRSILA